MLPFVFPHFQATKVGFEWFSHALLLSCPAGCLTINPLLQHHAKEVSVGSSGAVLNLRAALCSAMQTCPPAGAAKPFLLSGGAALLTDGPLLLLKVRHHDCKSCFYSHSRGQDVA